MRERNKNSATFCFHNTICCKKRKRMLDPFPKKSAFANEFEKTRIIGVRAFFNPLMFCFGDLRIHSHVSQFEDRKIRGQENSSQNGSSQ